MASQIEEFLAKKKEQTTLLDLHNCTANSKEELRKLIEKVPEFKIKPEKKLDDIKIREKKFKFKLPKKEGKKSFPFAEPTPSEMKEVSLEELYSVNIPWKMLTPIRPKSKIDEEYFSRQVELGKATLKTRHAERRTPRDAFLRKRKNASGGVEARFLSCRECGVEFCTGDGCKVVDYDSFRRTVAAPVTLAAGERAQTTQQKNPSRKKKKKKKKEEEEEEEKKGSNGLPQPKVGSRAAAGGETPSKNNGRDVISVRTNRKNSAAAVHGKDAAVVGLTETMRKTTIKADPTSAATKDGVAKKQEILKTRKLIK